MLTYSNKYEIVLSVRANFYDILYHLFFNAIVFRFADTRTAHTGHIRAA